MTLRESFRLGIWWISGLVASDVGAASHSKNRANRFFGTTGLMTSLLVGILMNILERTLEFLAAVPAPGAAPPS